MDLNAFLFSMKSSGMLQKKGSTGDLYPERRKTGPFPEYDGTCCDMDILVKSIHSHRPGAASGCFIPVDFVGMRGIKYAMVFRPVLRTGKDCIVFAHYAF
jgi:hypothetical protein